MDKKLQNLIKHLENSFEHQKATANQAFATNQITKANYFMGLAQSNEFVIEKLKEILNA